MYTPTEQELNKACQNCFFYEPYSMAKGDCDLHAEKHNGVTLVGEDDCCENWESKTNY